MDHYHLRHPPTVSIKCDLCHNEFDAETDLKRFQLGHASCQQHEDQWLCKECIENICSWYKGEMVDALLKAVGREGGYKPSRTLCFSEQQFQEDKVRYRVCQSLKRRLKAILQS